MSNDVDQAVYAFKAVLTMRRGSQTLDKAEMMSALGTRLFPESPFIKGAATSSEDKLPVVDKLPVPYHSTTEGTSTSTTTDGTSTFTTTVSTWTSTAAASLTASNANASLVIPLLFSFVCLLWCGICMSCFRSRICKRRQSQPVPIGPCVDDFVNAARRMVAKKGGNHSESVCAEGDIERLCQLGFDEHWLLPAGSIALSKSLKPSSDQQHVRGTLSGSIDCMVRAVCIPTHTNSAFLELCNEVRIARLARHPNIILFLGVASFFHENSRYLCMVHEWVQGCTLEAYVAQRDQRNQSADQVAELRILLYVVEAMNFLHSMQRPIVHRALRPHNVLIETVVSPPRAKLSNFARAVHGDEVLELHGPRDGYIAPEVADAEPYTQASDIFSFGGMSYYLLCGEHPSHGMCEMDSFPNTSGETSSAVVHLTNRCRHQNPAARPRFREVYGLLDLALRPMEEVGDSH